MRSGYDLIPSQAQYQTHVITSKASRAKDVCATQLLQDSSPLLRQEDEQSFLQTCTEQAVQTSEDHKNAVLSDL